jgi:hypothetical protein
LLSTTFVFVLFSLSLSLSLPLSLSPTDFLAWEDPGVGKHCIMLFCTGLAYMLIVALFETNFFSQRRKNAVLPLVGE